MFTIILPGAPRGKGRPRFSKKTGGVYTETKTEQYENRLKGAMTTTTITTEVKYLECRLTEEERRTRADDAAEASERAAKLHLEEESLKDQVKEKKVEAEGFEREAGRLLRIYRLGVESRNVDVRHEYDDITKMVCAYRLDTGELIEGPRPPTRDEMQKISQVTMEEHAHAKKEQEKKGKKLKLVDEDKN